jgi:hypothetical protein
MAETERPDDQEQRELDAIEKRRASMGLFYEERLPELEPKSFAEGFTPRTMLGALFVAIIMLPGSIYLSLFMGSELGPAAEWTTIILFVEVARRSFTVLRRQEIYLIYCLAGAAASAGGGFGGMIWQQFLRQSQAAKSFGIADLIPTWVSPPLGSTAYVQRTFFHHDWTWPIALLLIGTVLGFAQWVGMGYFLFRITSDIERLPFPLAPVAAQGATALAEVSEEKETWRWAVFSTGTMVGLAFGLFYIFIPVISGAFLLQPIKLLPIPFLDLTPNTEGAFPTGRFALDMNLGSIIAGFIIPYPIVVGGFISSVITNFFFSPMLYRYGIAHGHNFFPTWKPGMGLIQTDFATGMDLWISVGIGTSLAIAVIGLWQVTKSIMKARKDAAGKQREIFPIPEGRGDFSMWTALGAWFVATIGVVIMAHVLVPKFPLWIIVFFAFIWSPLNSYVSTRLIGLTGRPVAIPYLGQAVFILSKYRGVDIWFAPIPINDFSGWAVKFREVELTGTKMTSIIKAQAFSTVLILVFSFIYWSFFWKISEIPSAQYPYAQAFWPLTAQQQALVFTGTLEGQKNYLLMSLKFPVIGYAAIASMLLYGILSLAGVHYLWFYGLIGFGGSMLGSIPTMIGALLGRYYMMKRFGVSRWQLYTPVLMAGFSCGMGLIGMLAIALGIIFKAVRTSSF